MGWLSSIKGSLGLSKVEEKPDKSVWQGNYDTTSNAAAAAWSSAASTSTSTFNYWIPLSVRQKVKDHLQVDLDHLQQVITEDPTIGITIGCVGTVSFLVGFRVGRLQKSPNWRRLTNIADIPSTYVGPEAPLLKGRVVSVSDGDTVRFLHVPNRIFYSTQLGTNEKLSEVALPIRICTIDTPETAKFGKPGQPFGEEAKQHLQSMVEHKIVHLRLLTKDQYGRGVAELQTGPFWPFVKYVDQEMLKVGLAEVYQGGGAVYGRKEKVCL